MGCEGYIVYIMDKTNIANLFYLNFTDYVQSRIFILKHKAPLPYDKYLWQTFDGLLSVRAMKIR